MYINLVVAITFESNVFPPSCNNAWHYQLLSVQASAERFENKYPVTSVKFARCHGNMGIP